MSMVYLVNSVEGAITLKQNFQQNKVVIGKTLFFVIGSFGTSDSIFLTLASNRAVFCGNVSLSILVHSTEKQYSSFLKKVSFFRKIVSKLN